MLIPDPLERMLRIPVHLANGHLQAFDGAPLPPIKDGTQCDLVLPAYAVRDRYLQKQLATEQVQTVLPAKTELWAQVEPRDFGPFKGVVEMQQIGWPLPGGVVKVLLCEPLKMRLRANKRAQLLGCRCVIPALKDKRPESLNQAYSHLAAQFEPWRRSVSGSVFRKFYYSTKSRDGKLSWDLLETLRLQTEAQFHSRLFPSEHNPNAAEPSVSADGEPR